MPQAKSKKNMAKRENDSFSVKDLMQSFINENNLSKGMQKIKAE